MALSFQPKVGSVLMCDFEGFVEPEIVKKRPVVVIARNRANSHLVTLVPLSTTEPQVMETHHYRLPRNPVPAHKGKVCWAKCDLIATVSIARLDRLKDGWTRVVPNVTEADLAAIRKCVVHAMQLQNTLLGLPLSAGGVKPLVGLAGTRAANVDEEAIIPHDEVEVPGRVAPG